MVDNTGSYGAAKGAEYAMVAGFVAYKGSAGGTQCNRAQAAFTLCARWQVIVAHFGRAFGTGRSLAGGSVGGLVGTWVLLLLVGRVLVTILWLTTAVMRLLGRITTLLGVATLLGVTTLWLTSTRLLVVVTRVIGHDEVF
jgi:hypothetical protein